MQFKKSTLLVALTLLLVVGANTLVITNPVQPDPGHTDAPGENSCATSGCHSGTALSGNLLDLNVGTTPFTSYTPGATHNLVLNAQDYNWANGRNGFQITALDANEDSIGQFVISNAASTTKTEFFDRQYVSHLNATPTVAWTFRWNAPAAGSGPVTFYVAVNLSNGDSTSSGDRIYTHQFTVTETATNPCANFNASITTPGNANSFCSGGSLDLTAGSSNGPGNPTYSWSTTNTGQTINVNTAGTYTVTVTEGACTASASLTVSSVAAGVPAFTANVTDNVVTINNNSTGVDGNYTWNFGDGTELNDNSASFSYTYDSVGTYTITLSYTDVCGNPQTTNGIVSIDTLVGIGQLGLAEVLSIYPNPFGSQASINVNGFNGVAYQFILVDITGRTVRRMEGMGGAALSIDREGLQSGMYFYSIELQGQKAQGKLLID